MSKVKGQGHAGTMHTAKMCLNSVGLLVIIYPLHTWVVTFDPPTTIEVQTARPLQRRVPSNGAENSGLYHHVF